ncbi:MAG: error-prone DNA polymerase [Pirellulaceae bacterium]
MYAELHCKSNFSFLEGASHAEELAARAAELGYAALAVTDRHSLAGVVRAHIAAKQAGLKLLVGAEITPDDAPPIVLWASDRAAYGRLSRLITVGRRRAEKGHCRLFFDDVAAHCEGLLAGVVGSHSAANVRQYAEVFGDRVYLLLELLRGADDRRHLDEMLALSQRARVPLAAAGDVRYHVPKRRVLADVLTAIRHGTTVAEAKELLEANAQRHLRTLDDLANVYADAPDALHRTREVAERCNFSLDELRYEYPEELAPPGMTPAEYLATLAWKGALKRYPGGIPDKVRGLVEHELKLIAELRYEAYFLTVFDLVRFARRRGILCQGRGSAANSAVCFCLGVTSVDPDRTDVLFERFVSRERNEAPDIDVDFEHERREEVLQYLYEKYGRERAGMTGVVITYRSRSAVRDAGKALGLSLDRVDALAKQVEGYAYEPKLAERCRQVGIDPESETGRRLVYVINELIGFPRHLSQHVGGMVITNGPLCELAPIENAAMQGRTVIEWDKDDLDELGILKVDCLALGMLSAIRKCFEMVEQHHGTGPLTLASIPEGDPRVYDMICQADTMGVFQIESRAQMSMLPRLRPRCYYDLVIEVAIVRPGPIQGDMVHPYLRRRASGEQVEYPNDEIREVLHKTLGVPIFQEQAMRLAVVAAGFTPGEADQLRRAMAAWRRPGLIDQFRIKLLDGMRERGLSQQFAEQVFNQIRGFGEYGFPESHAASFALLVYVSAWLKHYYPAAFCASIINSQPMGFYAPAQLIRDARAHGVAVRPVEVNASCWDCTLEEGILDFGLQIADCHSSGSMTPPTDSFNGKPQASARPLKQGGRLVERRAYADASGLPLNEAGPTPAALRLGLRMITGLPAAAGVVIERARQQGGPFRSVEDFSRRTRLGQSVIAKLAEADALASLGRDRRSALWEALSQEKRTRDMPLFDSLAAEDEPPARLPELAHQQQVFEDYRTTGLSLKGHPVAFHREALDRLRVVPAGRLEIVKPNRHVRVAGIVLLRQRPSTAKGITFVTLEDETGIANLVLRQAIWERYYEIARRSPAWIAHGKLERKDRVIHVLVNRLEDLSRGLGELNTKSRDFR